MSSLLLVIHIALGISAVMSALHGLVPALHKLEKAYLPSVVATFVSGVGLAFTGASITRVCISGGVLLVALVVINRYTGRKAALSTVEYK